LLLTGESLEADEAHRLGFVARVLTSSTAQAELTAWYRETLAPLSAFAIRQATKASRRASGLLQSLQTPLSQIERQYVDELLESRDGNEGIAAFLERRKPVWKDC
jgi:enoyl-CoA hydratase/carnithine racemase